MFYECKLWIINHIWTPYLPKTWKINFVASFFARCCYFHKPRIQKFQVLINFFKFWPILKFVAHRNMYFKRARSSVHTLKTFSKFQMDSRTYLDIKMKFFEFTRPTNQKDAMGIWEWLEECRIHRFSQFFHTFKAVIWIQKCAWRLLEIFTVSLAFLVHL